jgi:hypothetical protein
MDIGDVVTDHFVTDIRRRDHALQKVKLRVERLHIGAIGSIGMTAAIRTSGKAYLSCQRPGLAKVTMRE